MNEALSLLLKMLSLESFTVYTKDSKIIEGEEDSLDDFDEGEAIIVVTSPTDSEKKLYLFVRKSKMTLIFEHFSIHSGYGNVGNSRLLHLLDKILNNEAYVIEISYKEYSMNAIVFDNNLIFSDNADIKFNQFLNDKELLLALSNGTACVERKYWIGKTDSV